MPRLLAREDPCNGADGSALKSKLSSGGEW